MSQQKLIQKKKEKVEKSEKRKRLNTEITFLSLDETIKTRKEIREQLRVLFKYHISLENSISRFEIFEEVLKINPYKLDIYRRTYWWRVIERSIKEMKEDCFIVRKGSSYFVLKTEEELAHYKKVTNRMVDNIKHGQTTATLWVKNKRWRYV